MHQILFFYKKRRIYVLYEEVNMLDKKTRKYVFGSLWREYDER